VEETITPTKGRVWNWKFYIFLILILALCYLPFPNRHPQYDGIKYYAQAKALNWNDPGLLPANDMLVSPVFNISALLAKNIGFGTSLSHWLSVTDSLVMIVALVLLYAFYRRITGSDTGALWSCLALGVCFSTWYFATDIENVALTVFASSLLLCIGWQRNKKESFLRGILMGLLGTFAALCHQSLIVLAIFTGIYLLRQRMIKQAVAYFSTLLLTLILVYLFASLIFYSINTISGVVGYVFGYVGQTGVGGWHKLDWSTPMAGVIGFSRAFLGLHPLMNIAWFRTLAINGLPGNILSNQIAIASGIPSLLQTPLIISTFVLLLSLPIFLTLAVKGVAPQPNDKSSGADKTLMLVYAIVTAILALWWLPQGGEFWLSAIIFLIPLVASHLLKLKPVVWIYAFIWVGLLAFTNLFGSIRPFADETVDPTLPSILYLDEIRQPDDLYLIPYSEAYPQRWVFPWVIPVNAIVLESNLRDERWERLFRKSRRIVYYSSELLQLKSGEETDMRDPAYIMTLKDWADLTRNYEKIHSFGEMEILAAKR